MTAFEELMALAHDGDPQAQMEILRLVEPIIHHYSILDGKVDEDLRQQIILKILVGIKNWSRG